MNPASGTTKFQGDVRLEYICSYWATLTPPEVIGPLAEGLRLNVYVKEGEIHGPKLSGRFRQGGGDWLTLRGDGMGILDVRATFEVAGGALVYTTYGGVADTGPDGYQKFLNGYPPSKIPLRIAPRYYTGHAEYLWMNRLQCVGIGEADMEQLRVTYDIYAIR